jgi:outer membrane protein OmpA-like peptidoglycan-associated protein
MKIYFSFFAWLLIAASAWGQQPIGAATAEELAEQLAPPVALTRTLRIVAPAARKLDLSIQFDYNSAKLQDSSRPLLLNLATAMGSERIKELKFRIEGHTDSSGKATYNQQLSQRRAASVLEFLAQQGVDKQRLQAEGKGSTEPLYPEKPEAMENRRVRITTLD